jgi:hypothetical protein
MTRYVEPLDAAIWFRRIEMIAQGAFVSLESSLRHASHLLQLTPLALRPLVGLSTDVENFEELLEAGNLDTAARFLVAQPTALSVHDEPGARRIRATIQCSALKRPMHGWGNTIAEAVLDAWTKCLLAIRSTFEDLSGPTYQEPMDEICERPQRDCSSSQK